MKSAYNLGSADKPSGFRDRAIVYSPEDGRLVATSRKGIKQRSTDYAAISISRLQSRVPIYVDAEVDLTKDRQDADGQSNEFLATVLLSHLSLGDKFLRIAGAMPKLYVPRVQLETDLEERFTLDSGLNYPTNADRSFRHGLNY